MWDESKVDQSFLILDGEKINLAEISDNEKNQMMKDLIKDELNDLNGTNEPDNLKEIEALNKKVKKKKENIQRNGPLFKEFGQLKDEYISNDTLQNYIDRINEDDDIKRKNQKIKGITEFKEMNNELVEMRDGQNFKMDKRKGIIQESFLKFPKMPNGTIPEEKYCEILSDYYKENFPDYKIKAVVFHGDEESLNDDLKDCGAHAHIFVSAKNSKTGKYDLVKEQQKQGINFIKENPELFPHIDPKDLKQNYNFHKSKDGLPLTAEQKKENREDNKNLRAIGQAQQIGMMKHCQKHLDKYGVSLYRNEYKTEAEKKRLAEMEADKKKPKEQRLNNNHNAEIDKEKKQLKHYKKLNKKAQDKNETLNRFNNQLDNEIQEKNDVIKEKDNEINEKNSVLKTLEKHFEKFLDMGKDFANKVFNKSPKEEIQQQAEKTAKTANSILHNSSNQVKKSVLDTANKISEATGSNAIQDNIDKQNNNDKTRNDGICYVCNINKVIYMGKCSGCYNEDEAQKKRDEKADVWKNYANKTKKPKPQP